MKKISCYLYAIALAFLAVGTAMAQPKVIIKAGLNLANFTGDIEDDTKLLPTFLVGGQAEFDLAENLAVGAGLQLSGKGFKVDDPNFDAKINPLYLQVPVQIIYRNSGFFVGAGPFIGFGIAGKRKVFDESESIAFGNGEEDDVAPLDYGAGLELGYEFMSFRATAAYNVGLANVIPSDQRGDASVKTSVIGIALAYIFGGSE
ncbi:MAG: PorT family protein [Lewinellaceae bacterium]|nr:PorT family protein [Saprospiraceae bacterium]MCB9329748.1 PorT family protein [Lewinellaceae bacterium]